MIQVFIGANFTKKIKALLRPLAHTNVYVYIAASCIYTFRRLYGSGNLSFGSELYIMWPMGVYLFTYRPGIYADVGGPFTFDGIQVMLQ